MHDKKDGFLKIPIRLFDLWCEEGSKITQSHLVLYGTLLKRANWHVKPAETGKLNIVRLLKDLGWKRQYFYSKLNDLICYEFIERVYEKGKKRSSTLKVRFREEQ